MNKILNFKKIVFVGFFAAFLAVFLSAGTAQASFWDWFNVNKTNNNVQQQQAAAVSNTKAIIADPVIKVTSPDGGEVWKAGTKKNIVFKGNLRAIVDLRLEWSGGALPIGESVTLDKGKTSNYSWFIPPTIEERKDYKIRIDYKGGQGSDLSDKTFTIKNASASPSSKSSSSKSSKSSSSSKSSATTTSTYILKINKSGKGYVSDGGNLSCGTKCQDKYWAGAEVKLTAVPNGGYVFEKFAPEKECSSIYSDGFGFNDSNKWTKQAFAYREVENVVCVTTMNKSKTITAIFKKIATASSSSSKSSSSRSSKSSSSKSSISSSTSSSQQTPSITITYPQAGYTLYNGLIKEDGTLNTKPIATIQWNEQNGDYPVDIYLLNQTGNQIKVIAQKAPDTGSYIWAYDPTLPNGAHQYQIRISTEYSRNKGGSTSAYSGHFIISNKIMY